MEVRTISHFELPTDTEYHASPSQKSCFRRVPDDSGCSAKPELHQVGLSNVRCRSTVFVRAATSMKFRARCSSITPIKAALNTIGTVDPALLVSPLKASSRFAHSRPAQLHFSHSNSHMSEVCHQKTFGDIYFTRVAYLARRDVQVALVTAYNSFVPVLSTFYSLALDTSCHFRCPSTTLQHFPLSSGRYHISDPSCVLD